MRPAEFPTYEVRPSETDRERALEVLREGASSGRLSHDTFLGRMELVLHATSRAELDTALAGLPLGRPLETFLLRTVGRVSGFRARLVRAWRTERLPGLDLPQAGARTLTIGRTPVLDYDFRTPRCPGATPSCGAKATAGCCTTSARPTAHM